MATKKSAPAPALASASAPKTVKPDLSRFMQKEGVEEFLKSRIQSKKTVFQIVPIDQIFASEFNPRDKDSFLDVDPDFTALCESLDLYGFLDSHAVSLHYDPTTKLYETIVGHRRLAAARKLGIDLIPSVVLTGLSREEICRLVLDHSLVKGLNESEELTAFMTMVLNGYSRRQVCVAMKWFTKGKINVQRYDFFRRLSLLPVPIQNKWRIYKTDGRDNKAFEDGFIPSNDALKKLYKASQKDEKNKFHGLPENGPEFKAAMATIKKENKEDGGSKKLFFDRSQLKQLAGMESRLHLRIFFKRISGEIKGDPYALLKVLHYMHDKAFGPPKGVEAITKEDIVRLLASAEAMDNSDSDSDSESDSAPIIIGNGVSRKADSHRPTVKKTVKRPKAVSAK